MITEPPGESDRAGYGSAMTVDSQPDDGHGEVERVAELIGKARIAWLTTVHTDGTLQSRPMAILDRPFDGDLYFFTSDASTKAGQLEADEQVNVAFQTGRNYVSISGGAALVHDRAMIEELWNVQAEAWFDDGKDDPAVALLKVHAESAEYWELDTPRPLALVKYARAVATGRPPDVGHSTEVDL
jgi:general stress protein 26